MAEHDALFKRVFSVPARATEELRCVLPPAIAAAIDFSRLARMPSSYVTEQMRQRHADLLFSAPLGYTSCYVYVLFEHQSTPDPIMPFRVHGYMHSIWEEHLSTHGDASPLPPIINIILHHGDRAWGDAPRTMHAMVSGLDQRPELAPLVPNFTLLIEDLTVPSLRALAARPMTPIVRVAIWLLRDARNPNALLANLPHWARDFARLVTAEPRHPDTTFLMEYIFEVAGWHNLQRLFAALRRLAPETVKPMTSAADYLRQQGLEKGLEATREMFRDMLAQRFGEPDEPTKQRIAQASFDQLRRWGPRIITAPTLEAIFTD